MNRRMAGLTGFLLAVGIVADVLTGAKNVPGYSAAIGLLGGIAIILGAQGFGRFLLKPEGWYAEDAQEPESGQSHHD